ncbi:MAG: hypothetical protein ACTSPY_02500 [Candidatus Helarchaeota archaeon]
MQMPNPVGVIYNYLVGVITLLILLVIVGVIVGIIAKKYKFAIICLIGVCVIFCLNWILINFFDITLINWWIFWEWLRNSCLEINVFLKFQLVEVLI